jgi:hypothetical protein
MNATTGFRKTEPSLVHTGFALLRHYLGGRVGLIVLTVALLAAGVATSWSWLVAAGIAPLLLALAPCAAMCAIGLCAHKVTNKADAPQPGSNVTTDATSKAPDAPRIAAAVGKSNEPQS